MQFSTIFTSALALAMGVAASPVAPVGQGDVRNAQLRIWGEPSCESINLGEIGIYASSANECLTFGDNNVRSVSIESIIDQNCKLAIYEDVTCHLGGHVDLQGGQCLSGAKSYGSYRLTCPV